MGTNRFRINRYIESHFPYCILVNMPTFCFTLICFETKRRCRLCQLVSNVRTTVATLYQTTVYPKKYTHGFVVLCFVVVMQSFIMNSHEVFIHIHQGCFAGTGAIVRLPQCQWSKPVGYGKISQCITTTKHSKAKTVCIFLGIYCTLLSVDISATIVDSCDVFFLILYGCFTHTVTVICMIAPVPVRQP